MSEQTPEFVEAPPAHVAAETGVPEVDQVLADLAASTEKTLAEQVQVLEDGHAALRRALG